MFSHVDLHVHSTASDGRKTPAEVVSLAASRGLRLISLTDHDTTQGYTEARAKGEALGVRVIAGVEINTDSPLGEVHLIGYFARPDHSGLQTALSDLRDKRLARAMGIVEKLNRQGVPISIEQVQGGTEQAVVTRAHIAQALYEGGWVSSKSAAFELYIGRGRPAFVERYAFEPQQAIDLIRSAGGVVSLAHPIRSGNVDRVPALVEMDLQALEVYCYDHSSDEKARLSALADQYGLLRTGGSDFHGEQRGAGRTLGSVWVPEADGEKLWDVVFA